MVKGAFCMTDCGAVDDWLNEKAFQDFYAVIEYVRQKDDRWGETNGNLQDARWGNFWDCVNEHDFDTELKLVKIRIHSKKRGTFTQEQLRRIDRKTKIYLALNLDQSTRMRIKELLRSGV